MYSPPPPSGRYIHGGRVGEGKGRGKVYYLFVTKSVHHFGELFYTVLQNFIPNYCTVHHIPLYFLTIGWIFHVIQYMYTRYEILLCSLQYIGYTELQQCHNRYTVIQYIINCTH